MFEQLSGIDACGEVGVENEDPVEREDVRDEVVGKRGQPVQIVEVGDAGEPQV